VADKRYLIVVVSRPADTPAVVRLRLALKALGRLYGLRCVEVRELPAGGPGADPGPPDAADATPGGKDGG
jgi:hypothetical protein